MHELSIASSIVDLVTQELHEMGSARATAIRLRIGALSCIHQSALLYSFQLVTDGTELSDAQLEIETVPVTIFCSNCQAIKPLESIQSFRCPSCQTLSADIRSGKELEIHSIEYEPAFA
ncbi:MAG: hydrogenase maturation nickel metallochaperone HypA [Pirellulales bacterium]